jgi:DNA-binding transcriptional LysR family regulator
MSNYLLKNCTDKLSIHTLKFYRAVAEFVSSRIDTKSRVLVNKFGQEYQISNKATMLRRLHTIEEDIGNLILFNCRSDGIKGLTPIGDELLLLAQNVLNTVSQHEEFSPVLRIAASEAVSTYLFPDVLADMKHDNNPQGSIQTGLFRPAMLKTDGAISSGVRDLAIAWDVYRGAISKWVKARQLKGSDTEVVLVFHPLHPFGKWVAKNPWSEGPEYRERLLGEIRKHTIVYPRALKKLAAKLGQINVQKKDEYTHSDSWLLEKCIAVESFPAVATHVRMKVGIGLFPGWGWLLGQLTRESHIQYVPLPVSDSDRKMSLMYYQRKDREHPKAPPFIQRLEDKLAELNGRESDDFTWYPIEWNSPFNELTPPSFRQEWSAYYINGGKGDMAIPHWRQGKWTFTEIPVDDKYPLRCAGEFVMRPTDDEKMDLKRYHLRVELNQSNLLVSSFPIINDHVQDDQPAFLRFTKVFGRDPDAALASGYAELMILGLIYVPQGAYSAVAPFMLTSRETELGVQDFRQISNLIRFYMHGDLVRLHTISFI